MPGPETCQKPLNKSWEMTLYNKFMIQKIILHDTVQVGSAYHNISEVVSCFCKSQLPRPNRSPGYPGEHDHSVSTNWADFSRVLQENWHNLLKIPTLSLSLFFATAFFLLKHWIHSSKMLKGICPVLFTIEHSKRKYISPAWNSTNKPRVILHRT